MTRTRYFAAGAAVLLVWGVALEALAQGQAPRITTTGQRQQQLGAPAAPRRAVAVTPQGAVAVTPEQTRVEFADDIAIPPGGTAPAGVRVQARFADLLRAPQGRGLEGIIMSGVLRADVPPAADGGTVMSRRQLVRLRARVQWDAVTAPAPGSAAPRREWLDSPLQSRFGMTRPQIASGTLITARGDVSGAVAAARRLLDSRPEGAPAGQTQAAAIAPGARSARQAAQPGGTGGDEDKLQVPELTLAPPAPESPPAVYATTSDGCTPVVDEPAGVVRGQSQITINGVAQGACSDDGHNFVIRGATGGCPSPRVDIAAGVAHQQYRRFWVDRELTTHYIDSDCIDRPDTTYSLYEDAAGCTDEIDLTTLTAWKRAALVFNDGTGLRNTVEACRRTSAATSAAVTLTGEGCSLYHDFDAAQSIAYQRVVYNWGDGAIVAQGCVESDDSERYDHTISGDCTATIDLNSSQAFARTKVQIVVDGTTQDITGCTIDDDASPVPVIKTADGCTTAFHHDIAVGQSFGYARWYHNLSAEPTYITDCELDSDQVYAHGLSEPHAWVHDDDTHTSQALRAIEIEAHGGTVTVDAAAVRDGDPAIAHEYIGQTTEASAAPDATYYEGGTAGACDAWTRTVRVDEWRRPDTSLYTSAVGAGVPIGPRNACEITVSAVWDRLSPGGVVTHARDENDAGVLTPDVCTFHAGEDSHTASLYAYRYLHSSTYQGTRTVTREDDYVAATETGTGLWTNSSVPLKYSAPDANDGDCYNLPDTYDFENLAPSQTSNAVLTTAWVEALSW